MKKNNNSNNDKIISNFKTNRKFNFKTFIKVLFSQ